MYCKNCGAELKEGQKFCAKCGTPVKSKSSNEENTSRQGERPIEKTSLSTNGTQPKKVNTKIIVAVAAVVAVVAVIIIAVAGQSIVSSHSVLMLRKDEETIFGSNYEASSIHSVTFYDTIDNVPQNGWDVSYAQDGSVMAWVEPNGDKYYDLYIAGKGGVYANPNSGALFYGYKNLKSINFNGSFHTDDVYSMKMMFRDCNSLTSLDVSDFDTSNVTDMVNMFSNCGLTTLEAGDWDTSNVTNMKGMFYYCESLTTVDASGWDTSNVTDMSWMFQECKKLENLYVNNWNTSNVTDMVGMFYDCRSLTFFDISNWDTSKAGITVEDLLNQRKIKED